MLPRYGQGLDLMRPADEGGEEGFEAFVCGPVSHTRGRGVSRPFHAPSLQSART